MNAGGSTRPEAPTGVEPVMEVLQTSALPLGYGAGKGAKTTLGGDRKEAGVLHSR